MLEISDLRLTAKLVSKREFNFGPFLVLRCGDAMDLLAVGAVPKEPLELQRVF